MFVRTISSEPQNILSSNLVYLCDIISQSVMQKNWLTVFSVKVTLTARAYIIKIWLFLLYLLKCWSVCHQTWFDGTASQARVSCGKMRLLLSRSRSQGRFTTSVNVCLDNIFSVCLVVSAQHLLNCSTIFFSNQTWYDGVLSWSEVSCGKIGSLSSVSRSQWGLI